MDKRILLLEDNLVSLQFLHEALLPVGQQVDAVGTLSAGLRLARLHRHALFLCDANLPDGGPQDIYDALKQVNPDAVAVAITAEIGTDIQRALLKVGFREVWSKPITIASLQNSVARVLKLPPGSTRGENIIGLWDELSALRAVSGNQATASALRKMFLADLPSQVRIITRAYGAGDTRALRAECHKLLAGCGFVGAVGIGAAVKNLSSYPDDELMMKIFIQQTEDYLSID